MPNFRNSGASVGGVIIIDETAKGKSLADFTRFEPLSVRIRSRFFVFRRPDENKDTRLQKGKVIFHLFAGNSPPNQI